LVSLLYEIKVCKYACYPESKKKTSSRLAYEKLRKEVSQGIWLPGQKLPSVRVLAQKYQLSVGSVSRVLSLLDEEGLVNLRHGQGAFVREERERNNSSLNIVLLYFTERGETLNFQSSPFGWSVFEGCRQYGALEGYKISLCPIFPNANQIRNVLKRLSDVGVDGVLVMYAGEDRYRKYLRYLDDSPFPIVFIDNPDRNNHKLSYIAGDNLQIGIKAANYLVSKGHREILYLMSSDAQCYRDQLSGFEASLNRYGLSLAKENIIVYRSESEKYSIINRIYDKLCRCKNNDSESSCITAIYCNSDIFALSLIANLQNRGISIPRDVSIMGGTGSDIGAHHHPSLTTVSCGLKRMGVRACEILCQFLKSPECGPIREVMDAHVVERESTRAVNRNNIRSNTK